MDEILTSPVYYFRVDGDADYAITPSFNSFTFPVTFPEYWRQTPIPPATNNNKIPVRDQACRVSCPSFPIELAPIIPVAQTGLVATECDGHAYAYTERRAQHPYRHSYYKIPREQHHLIEKGYTLSMGYTQIKFVIVPKQNKWMIHVLASQATSELQDKYHNLENTADSRSAAAVSFRAFCACGSCGKYYPCEAGVFFFFFA
ncbi:hypothetical protein BO71DRAFT_96768 [Aspergillus ellipticus CBS 707.79]|uniref:Uncharacterized protein n=1 Tax=Aspergillus ellipticus CBS 707.79 TaxID=1448320 RepID=A0A319CX98_9EURO|nr:hypothetical protein BO71DRAFT_96768 [Aspergillus ellipticus CBS 707.79]